MSPEHLLGAWHLQRFELITSSGRTVWPLGEQARGLLIYDASGWVSAFLSRGARTALGVAGLEGASTADPSAKARAFDDTMSYVARWHLEGDTVVHTVQLALLPDAVGREQRRSVALDGEQLTLSYQLERPRGPRTYTLTWTRTEPM